MSNKMQEPGNFVPAIQKIKQSLNEQGQKVIEQKKTTENAIKSMSTDGDEKLEEIKHDAEQHKKGTSEGYAQGFKEQFMKEIQETEEKVQEGIKFQKKVEENITAVNTETGNNDFNVVLEQAQQELKNAENETNKIVEDMQETKTSLTRRSVLKFFGKHRIQFSGHSEIFQFSLCVYHTTFS